MEILNRAANLNRAHVPIKPTPVGVYMRHVAVTGAVLTLKESGLWVAEYQIMLETGFIPEGYTPFK